MDLAELRKEAEWGHRIPSEREWIEWAYNEGLKEGKANPVENRVSQPSELSCENCKQYKPYDEGLGECKWFSNKTKVDYIFTAKDFFCKQFEQK